MENYKIIKILIKNSGKKSYWKTFSRYINIFNNYLKNKPLSNIEKINHKNNEPRKFYLDILSKGFNIEIDYNSPLFEGRIDQVRKRYYYLDDSFLYERFFERISFFKKNNIPLTKEKINEIVTQGDVSFNKEYRDFLNEK